MIIKNIYDKINLSEQNEDTGKTLLQQTKDLINKFHSLFMETVRSVLENPELPLDVSKELFELRDQILKNAIAYGELPAVETYENVGRMGTLDESRAKTRDEWFRTGKPTDKEWFKKWFGSDEKKEI